MLSCKEATELMSQELRLFEGCGIALASKLGYLVGEKVPGRQLDDPEGHEADHQQRRDHHQDAPQRIGQHVVRSCGRR